MIAHCERCLTPCEVRGPQPKLDYTQVVMIAAEDEYGLCVCCAVQWWLHTVDPIRWALRDTGPGLLEARVTQQLLTPILAKQHAELGAVDWRRMLVNWDLPWPLDWPLRGEKG
jgi:hypothetical protein